MALRDYLNVPTREEIRTFVLAHGQAIAVLGIDSLGDAPQETWYFDENSMSEDNNENVIRPNDILDTEPGRYHLNMVQADWNMLFNKPDLATVATTGSYNDLEDKIIAGTGILMTGNEVAVDDTQFMSLSVANAAITSMQADINSKLSPSRTITINGITKDLSANRDWEVGNVSTDGSYTNPSWIASLAYSKLTGAPSLFSGTYADLTGKPTLFSGSYTDLTNKPAIPTNTNQLTNGAGFLTGITGSQVTTALGITPLDTAGARTAINLTTIGSSGASTYNTSTGVLNIPNYTSTTYTAGGGIAISSGVISQTAPTYSTTARTLNSSFRPSTTRPTRVSYTITHSITLTLILTSGSSMVYLEISPDNSTWTTISQAGYSDGVAVAVALTKTTTNNVQGEIPSNYYARLRAVTSGAGSAAFTCGQEVTY